MENNGEAEELIWNIAANRIAEYQYDIGLFIYSNDLSRNMAIWLSNFESLAVAVLLVRGYEKRFAAALVAHKLFYVEPHVRGQELQTQGDCDLHRLFFCGTYRLPDGSLWDAFGDSDLACIRPGDLPLDFEVVATRALATVDEEPLDRVKHLITRCDDAGSLAA